MSKQLQKEIIQNIETLRKKSGLSQSELGKKIGWNQKQISRLERGERKDLDYESTSLLAIALGVDIKTINPSFSNTNGKKENTVSKLIEELNSMIPNEIPVFLQRDCGNTNSDIVYYEYSANIRSQIDLDNNSPFPAGAKGEYFGMICELDYDLPAFSASDVLIADKNSNPIDPVFNTGNFVPNKWELYDRVIIKLNAPINNFYTHPAIWIGQGKCLIKTLEGKRKVIKYNEFNYLGVILSRRYYFNRSSAKSFLSARYGIQKKFGIRKWIPNI